MNNMSGEPRCQSLDTPLPDVPWYRSCRILLTFITAWGFVFFYLLRIDLTLAIVCMVRDPDTSAAAGRENTSNSVNGSIASILWSAATVTSSVHHLLKQNLTTAGHESASDCGTLNSGESLSKYTGELEWSKELRGYVLSSFFYGYIVTQVFGGWLASRYGGKHVFGTGMLITVIATILIPVAARAHVALLITLRVIMGLACGVGVPSTHHVFGQWLPPLERSKLITSSYSGWYIGTILALVLSGLMCDLEVDNGWPLIFYVYAAVTFIWWIFWNMIVYNSPETHPRIDPVEKDYIMKTIGSVAYEHNGLWSSLPHALSYIGTIVSGQLADLLRRRKILSTTVTRKLFQCISSGVPAVLIACTGFIDCERRYVAVTIISLASLINSCYGAGYLANHVDISPKHAGVLFGISNTVATIPGILAPTVVGLLTPNGSREEWMIVFFICSGFYVFSTIVYAVLGSGDQQPWAKSDSQKTVTITVD